MLRQRIPLSHYSFYSLYLECLLPQIFSQKRSSLLPRMSSDMAFFQKILLWSSDSDWPVTQFAKYGGSLPHTPNDVNAQRTGLCLLYSFVSTMHNCFICCNLTCTKQFQVVLESDHTSRPVTKIFHPRYSFTMYIMVSHTVILKLQSDFKNPFLNTVRFQRKPQLNSVYHRY